MLFISAYFIFVLLIVIYYVNTDLVCFYSDGDKTSSLRIVCLFIMLLANYAKGEPFLHFPHVSYQLVPYWSAFLYEYNWEQLQIKLST